MLECMRAMDGEKRTGIRARKRKMEKKDLRATRYNEPPFLSLATRCRQGTEKSQRACLDRKRSVGPMAGKDSEQ